MRLRILIHAHSLSGAGHFVRARALAAELSKAHDVTMTDAGRRLPLPLPPRVRGLGLERIRRDGMGLAATAADLDIGEAMARRRSQLAEAVQVLRPDVLLIEHYPFSKWQFDEEIRSLLEAARAANARIRVICSVRDLPLQTRYEECSAADYVQRVTDRLNRDFDLLLVHGDEVLTPFETVFGGASRLRMPVRLTGLVHHEEVDDPALVPPALAGRSFVLCSVGGGREGAALLSSSRGAWAMLQQQGVDLPDRLVLCHPAGESVSRCGRDDVIELPFTPRFDVLLRRAALSISHAGYNTCADLLRYRRPSILVPHPSMSDQAPRAALMAGTGAARVIHPSRLEAAGLAEMVEAMLRSPGAAAAWPSLDGAVRTRECIEGLCGGSIGPPPAADGSS